MKIEIKKNKSSKMKTYLKCLFILFAIAFIFKFALGDTGRKPRARVVDYEICSGKVSDACRCTEDVADCDFGSYQPEHNTVLNLHFSEETLKDTKKVCFCNTDDKVYLNLTSTFLPTWSNNVFRIDFMNTTGPINFNDAFSINFHGSLFIDRASSIHNIRSKSFGRGADKMITDGHESKCCSKIIPKQNSAGKTLFIKNSAIQLIHKRGFDSFHNWSSLNFETVLFHNIRQYGIIARNLDSSIEFVNCYFKNVSARGVLLDDFKAALLINSIFDEHVHPLGFQARSSHPDSKLIIALNTFNNYALWQYDAGNVKILYNQFVMWYDQTYKDVNFTSHKDRTFIVKHNKVLNLVFTNSSRVNEVLTNGKIEFESNLLSQCNCSLAARTPPKISFQNDSSCWVKNDGGTSSSCLLSFNYKMKSCKEDVRNSENFENECHSTKLVPMGYTISRKNHVFERLKPEMEAKLMEDLRKEQSENSTDRSENMKQDSDENKKGRDSISVRENKLSPSLMALLVMVTIITIFTCGYLMHKNCKGVRGTDISALWNRNGANLQLLS